MRNPGIQSDEELPIYGGIIGYLLGEGEFINCGVRLYYDFFDRFRFRIGAIVGKTLSFKIRYENCSIELIHGRIY
jgi:hypothetical protein